LYIVCILFHRGNFSEIERKLAAPNPPIPRSDLSQQLVETKQKAVRAIVDLLQSHFVPKKYVGSFDACVFYGMFRHWLTLVYECVSFMPCGIILPTDATTHILGCLEEIELAHNRDQLLSAGVSVADAEQHISKARLILSNQLADGFLVSN